MYNTALLKMSTSSPLRTVCDMEGEVFRKLPPKNSADYHHPLTSRSQVSVSPISMKTLQTLDFGPTSGPGEENHNIIFKEDSDAKQGREEEDQQE